IYYCIFYRQFENMIRRTFTIVLFIIFNTGVVHAKTSKVLFVGNSLTYSNNMLETLKEMIGEQSLNIQIDNSTPGGFSLADHVNANNSLEFSLTKNHTARQQ